MKIEELRMDEYGCLMTVKEVMRYFERNATGNDSV